MFNALQLKALMDARPFRPFKVHMSDGKSYDVPNHDSAFVTANRIEIGLDLDDHRLIRRSVFCPVLHISGIEELTPA